MQYIRNHEEVTDALKVSVPKDFQFKVLGKLVMDLEELAASTDYEPMIRESLELDFCTVKKMIRRRDVVGLSSLAKRGLSTQCILDERRMHTGSDASAFYIQYQLSAFLKKYPFSGADTRSPAIKSFVRAEQKCKLYNNENYKALVRMDKTGDRLFGGCLEEIRADIENLLGPSPNLQSVEVRAQHGPGTSLGPLYKKGKTTSYYKWSNLPYTVTIDALPYAKEAILADPRWIGALDHWYRQRCGNMFMPIDMTDFWSRIFQVVDGSRITSVPKSALTDRTIAIEPLLNVYLQLGVDRVFKKALKKLWKFDLSDQQLNRDLAEFGAKYGDFATIDLSSASDTISLKICELLLPPAWYALLLDLRSPKGVLDGFVGTFEKISSMGNGFTFALESIIFGALARHAMRRQGNRGEIAVYGDDIIVPTEVADDTIVLLEYAGFAINKEKSFVSGPFRESCGSDWFLGYDVRPVFLKREVKTVLDLFYLHNRLYAQEEKLDWSWNVHFKQTRAYIRKYIPKQFGRIYGPPSESLESHLFSRRALPGVGLHRKQLKIVAIANKHNRKTSFLFRKLMVSLKGTSAYENRWDEKKRLTTGNSFDVTRRDSVRYICTQKEVYLDFLAPPSLYLN